MSLVRMAGLIVLPLVATTLQASARPVPVKPEAPADQAPHRSPAPAKVAERPEKPQLILVLTPNTNVWHDAEPGRLPDSGPQPLADAIVGHCPGSNWDGSQSGRSLQTDLRLPRLEATRACLAARYPHAPPA